MPPCNQEEADTRMCVHLKDCLEKGARKGYIRTVDTDVIVILAGIFFELQSMYTDLDIIMGSNWHGKTFSVLPHEQHLPISW